MSQGHCVPPQGALSSACGADLLVTPPGQPGQTEGTLLRGVTGQGLSDTWGQAGLGWLHSWLCQHIGRGGRSPESSPVRLGRLADSGPWGSCAPGLRAHGALSLRLGSAASFLQPGTRATGSRARPLLCAWFPHQCAPDGVAGGGGSWLGSLVPAGVQEGPAGV